jgi:ABC-2 type transport system ATP-binding protein
MIIQINNLAVAYGETFALKDITFNLSEGATGLLGPNGAGKTTLIKTLLGFLKPNQGEASVLGMDVQKQGRDIRQKVGYMPEDDCLIPGMNGVDFVSYFGQLCGLAKEDAIQRAHEVLFYVGLGEARYRTVETYSVGMRQRIKLAQAFINDPQLLLLDEPTNGMDPPGRAEMLELIKDISSKKGISLILSSHLLPDVEYTCKEVVVIHQGNLMAQGNIQQLKGEHQKLYEVRIKGDMEKFGKELEKAGCKWKVDDEGMIKVFLKQKDDTNILFQAALRSDAQIRHMISSKHTLEDVFMKVVAEE